VDKITKSNSKRLLKAVRILARSSLIAIYVSLSRVAAQIKISSKYN